MRKILKLNIFLLVEEIVRFLVDWGPQIRIALFTNMRILKLEANRRWRFSLLSIILTDLLGNKTLLHGFKRSWFVICGFRSVLCVSRFVACDRNNDWRQRKTQLWRWLLKFRVRMFVKSAAKSQCSQRPQDHTNLRTGVILFSFFCFFGAIRG